MRRIVGLALAAVVAAGLVSCSDGESADDTTTTTTEAEAESTTTTTEALSDEQYADVTDDFGGQVEQAGGDFCQLMAASAFSPEAAPSNPEQVKAAVDEVVGYFRALAGAQGVDEPTAEVLTSLADDLQASAEASGYSLEFLNSEQTTQLFQREDYVQVMGSLLARSEQECGATAGTGGG